MAQRAAERRLRRTVIFNHKTGLAVICRSTIFEKNLLRLEGCPFVLEIELVNNKHDDERQEYVFT